MVEAQHLVSASKLVDTRAEQELLEDILEVHKPPVPKEAADLRDLSGGAIIERRLWWHLVRRRVQGKEIPVEAH